MSWITQSLLNDKNYIKERKDIESDEFNDLLMVERAIETLIGKGLLNEEEQEIISMVSGDKAGFMEKQKSQRETIMKKYVAICERIAYFLGGYFTDDGYIAYIAKKHRLSDEQVEIMYNYIKSPFRHKVAKKGSTTGYIPKPTAQGT